MQKISIEDHCRNLIQNADIGILSTADLSGNPDIRCLYSLRNPSRFPRQSKVLENLSMPWTSFFSTHCDSIKVKHFKANPNCALFFWNPEAVHGLTLYGRAVLSEDKKLKTELWEDNWLQFYPGGVHGADYGLLQFIPESAKGWHWDHIYQFQIGEKSK